MHVQDTCPPTRPDHRQTIRVWLYLGLVLLAQYLVGLSAVATKGITTDEPAHLFGGLAKLERGDHRFNPENGALPQAFDALPAWLGGVRLPDENNRYWHAGHVWTVAHQATFETDQNLRGYYMAGRALNALFGVGISSMVFFAARHIWGLGGGLFSFTLCAACPNLLAHAPLITSDAASVLFLPLAAWLYWRMLKTPTSVSIAWASIGLGLACIAKFSAIFLGPSFVILLSIRAIRMRGKMPWAKLALGHGAMIATAWVLIWAAFGFQHGSGGPQGTTYYRNWGFVYGPEGSQQRALILWLKRWPIFPEPFVYGAGYVASSSAFRLNYFLGEVREGGSLGFFPYLFLVKTPVPTLLAMFGGLATLPWALCRARGADELYPWAVWGGVYGVFILCSNLNIGHRHMLPLYPTLFILAGGLWVVARERRTARLAVAALAVGAVLASAWAYPHYIAYFNRLDGGPENAWRKVADSSVDWGHDLPALRDWLATERRPDESLYLGYYGTDEPQFYGIEATELPRFTHLRVRPWYELHGGLYALNVTMLHVALYPWTPMNEAAYADLRQTLGKAMKSNDFSDKIKDMAGLGSAVERLRANRLAAFLRTQEPIANIGYSYLVFRLTEEQARDVELGRPVPLRLSP